MTDEQDSTGIDTTSGEGQAPTAEETAPKGTEAEATADAAKETEQEDAEDGDLPESVKKKMSKLRGEAASWRTQVRDLQAKLEGAATPEQVEALKAETAKQIIALEREVVLAKYPLPKELADRLKGSTREEMLADAKELSKYVTAPSDDEELTGGLTPSKRTATDPASLAKAAAGRRRNRF